MKIKKTHLDERFLQLNDAWKAMLLLHARLVADLEENAAAHGVIEPSTFHVLGVLMKAGKKARFRYLSEHVLIKRAGLSRLLLRLEDQKYIRREPCEDDERGLDIILTDKGEAVFAEALPVYKTRLEERFGAHLDPNSVSQLTDILRRVLIANEWLRT